MTELRDARLRKALDSAPDAQVAPDVRTRRAISALAREAIAPPAKLVWWKQLWSGAGQSRAPWNAAFATLALATLVIVLWSEREIPGARPDASSADSPASTAPAPARPASAAIPEAAEVAGVPAVAKANAPAPAQPRPASPRTARKAEATAPSAGSAAERSAPPASPPPAPPPPPSAEPSTALSTAPSPEPSAAPSAGQARERRAESATGALRDQDARALAKSAPSPQRADAAGLAESPVGRATQLCIQAGSRNVQLPLAHPSRIVDLVNRVALGARSTQPLESPVEWRIELRGQGDTVGVLELAGSQVRWTQWRVGQRKVTTGRPDAALMQGLVAELESLLR